MYYHHEISTVCVFVITCQIAQGQNNNFNLIYGNPPVGYHYESWPQVQKHYLQGTYKIVSANDVTFDLPKATQKARNGKRKNSKDVHGAGGRGNHVQNNEDRGKGGGGGGGGDEDTGDDNDLTVAKEEIDAEEGERKKRGFSLSWPFISSDKDTDPVVTATAVSTSTTTTTAADADAAAADATTVTKTATTVTATAVAGSSSDSSGGASDPEVTVTAVTTSVTTNSTSYMDQIGSGMMHIVTIGQDMKTSLVVAAPYLPMVWKVAMFIMPGLSHYELLMLTVNVATVTAQSLQKYDSGQSVSSIITDAAVKAMWDSILSKRDTGSTIGEYASNIYESVKTTFENHLGYIPKYFSGQETTISSSTVTLSETTNDGEKVETVITTINNEMPKTDKATEDLKNKIISMKKHIKHSSESRQSSEGSVSGSDSDDDDADDESNILLERVEVDETLFDKVLQQSMQLQPEIIQKKSGEELVEYLNGLNIQLPQPAIETRHIFNAITMMMHFDDDEQTSKLVDVLSKTTNYFIAKGLEAKQLMK